MDDILQTLRGSTDPETDRRRFLTVQLLFRMLAAPDCHAKNFSVHLLADDRFRLTPLYDVMSAGPVIGAGQRRMAWQKIKLAMAVRSKNPHYRMKDVRRRHRNAVARRNALGRDFPASVAEPIFDGPEKQARRLTEEAAD